MKDTELAYAAGVIDADGCILVSKTKAYACQGKRTPGYHAKVQVKMVEPAAVELLSTMFGGMLWKQKPNAARGRPLFTWQLSDAAAGKALELLQPFLRVKRAQADNALAFRALREKSREHRTKVVGTKTMTGQYGQIITTPVTCLSDEFVELCDGFWLRSKELNQVGVR